jgi:hypothetical protein
MESPMAQVTIKIYQIDGSAPPTERTLTRTFHLETSSGKRLTSKRAGQLLAREFPEFNGARNGMIKTEEGWMATRSLRPTERCSFHYIWEKAVVSEDVESASTSD